MGDSRRRQNHSCDPCRKGKRGCDAPVSVFWAGVAAPRQEGSCHTSLSDRIHLDMFEMLMSSRKFATRSATRARIASDGRRNAPSISSRRGAHTRGVAGNARSKAKAASTSTSTSAAPTAIPASVATSVAAPPTPDSGDIPTMTMPSISSWNTLLDEGLRSSELDPASLGEMFTFTSPSNYAASALRERCDCVGHGDSNRRLDHDNAALRKVA
jgi:hypothetical protein